MLQIITGGIEKSLIQILKEMKNYPQFEFSVIVKTDKIEQSYIDVLQSIEVPLKNYRSPMKVISTNMGI